MSIYHENKSTYSRLMGGDGTALSARRQRCTRSAQRQQIAHDERASCHHVDFSRNGNGHKCHRLLTGFECTSPTLVKRARITRHD